MVLGKKAHLWLDFVKEKNKNGKLTLQFPLLFLRSGMQECWHCLGWDPIPPPLSNFASQPCANIPFRRYR